MGFNIKNNYGPNIEVNEGGRLTLVQGKDGLWHTADAEEAEYEEIKEEPAPDTKVQPAKQQVAPVAQETFADRVKAIMRKAARKRETVCHGDLYHRARASGGDCPLVQYAMDL